MPGERRRPHIAALKPAAQPLTICISACRDKAGKLGLDSPMGCLSWS